MGEIEWHNSMRRRSLVRPSWLVKYKSSLRQGFEKFLFK